jgi:D-alanine-D-alanine ligase
MRLVVVYNLSKKLVIGRPEDLVADHDMEYVPQIVARELTALGHEVQTIEADWQLLDKIAEAAPDLVVNLAESFAGTNAHDYLAPCVLEFSQVPYTGSDPFNLITLRDKVYTKDILRSHGFPMARHELIAHADNVVSNLPYPIILKPVREDGSLGIFYNSIIRSPADLREQVDYLLRTYRQPVLAEQFIIGREFSVGIVGNDKPFALKPIEFRFNDGDPLKAFRAFERKWYGGMERMLPASDIEDSILWEMQSLAVRAHTILRCRDYSRADFRVGTDGSIYFLEHNSNPGIGPNLADHENNTMTAEFLGVDYRKFLQMLLDVALERYR